MLFLEHAYMMYAYDYACNFLRSDYIRKKILRNWLIFFVPTICLLDIRYEAKPKITTYINSKELGTHRKSSW